jgi:hypothetical protein
MASVPSVAAKTKYWLSPTQERDDRQVNVKIEMKNIYEW